MKMGHVYILQSQKNGRFYIGSTIDIERRLIQHNSGRVTSTKNKGPWTLSLSQKFESITEARIIEIKLKNLKRRDYIEKIVREQKITISGYGAVGARPDMTSGRS